MVPPSRPFAVDRMYTKLISQFILPLQERMKAHSTVAVRRQMEASQWWPAQQLAQAKVERLRRFLASAQRAPYWAALFAERGFDPRAVADLSCLSALPLLDKATIRAHADAMKHPEARDLARFNTGGSSGEPLVFFIGKERVSHDVAAKWRATRWWGVDIGDPEIVVWGSPIELGSQDRVRALRDRLMRTQLLPAFEMTDAKVGAFLRAIGKRRPKMLFGYPSALSHIASHAQARGVRVDDLGIAVAFVTGERLYEEQRQIISTTFGCRVANGYGSRDAGFIAHECPQGSMHLTDEDLVVEIVDAQGLPVPAGESGEIVVTHMATQHFPFIRYRTGDMAAMGTEPCACGRGLATLREIQGRSTDFVVAADGTVMHGLALIYILRDMPEVQAFKIVQHTVHHTSVQVVPGPGFGPVQVASIVTGFQRRLGSDVRVDVQAMQAISAEKSGKYRYVISHVQR